LALGNICHFHDSHTILLTSPAKITPWLPNDDVWQLFLPISVESSVGQWLYGIVLSCGLTASTIDVP